MADRWSSGTAYEGYVGRWSRKVARKFVPWVAAAPQSRWLDVGCGTGALTSAILALADPGSVVGVDPSAAYVDHVRSVVTDPRAEFGVGDALALGRDDGEFDAVVSGLVLNFVPDPAAGLTEMQRVARAGATVAAYVWDYGRGMEMVRHFWDAAVDHDAAAAHAEEGTRFPLCQPEPLAALFAAAGLTGIVTDAIVVPTVFADFDDFWTPFLGGQGPAASYAMSLSEDARAELRELIRSRLPADSTGAIPLTARAWAVRGTVTR
ncbi:MAG TPA: class I SAM-dependent methyltransferase [Mycobacteriales bacterium]|nr:class I SAM-dependent methyltransferase [Mycobacteriales bacterium]